MLKLTGIDSMKTNVSGSKTSDGLLVIGAGLPRTGTMSLKTALTKVNH